MSEPIRPSTLLGGLFPDGVVAFEARAAVPLEFLHGEESRAIARAVPKRAQEFAAGRACAHRALAQLGITGFALRVGANREPLWPDGVTGSITHTAGFCGAAVARRTSFNALGIDAERRNAVHRRLWRHIATPAELERLERLAPPQGDCMATVLFSAKESFFKCQFPLTREWLNFSDVTVSVEPPMLTVVPCRTLALESRAAPPWRGRCSIEDNLIVTGLSLPPVTAPSSGTAA